MTDGWLSLVYPRHTSLAFLFEKVIFSWNLYYSTIPPCWIPIAPAAVAHCFLLYHKANMGHRKERGDGGRVVASIGSQANVIIIFKLHKQHQVFVLCKYTPLVLLVCQGEKELAKGRKKKRRGKVR